MEKGNTERQDEEQEKINGEKYRAMRDELAERWRWKSEKEERGTLTSKQYNKLSDWGERVALVGFGSLIVQQIVEGTPITSASVLVGAVITALAYYRAYLWLKKSK